MDEEARQLVGQRMAVGSGLTESGLSGQHHIPQDLWVEVRERSFTHGKGQHVSGTIDPTIARVEPVHPGVIDDQHAEITILTVEGCEQPQQDLSKRPGVDRDGLLLIPTTDGHWGFECAV